MSRDIVITKLDYKCHSCQVKDTESYQLSKLNMAWIAEKTLQVVGKLIRRWCSGYLPQVGYHVEVKHRWIDRCHTWNKMNVIQFQILENKLFYVIRIYTPFAVFPVIIATSVSYYKVRIIKNRAGWPFWYTFSTFMLRKTYTNDKWAENFFSQFYL